MNLNKALADWAGMLGDSRVLAAEAAQGAYGACTTGIRRTVLGALRVAEANQVAPVIAVAARCGVPVYPISTGRNWGYGSALPPTDGCVVLDLSGLVAIDFDADSGLLTVEPGVTQGMLADFLERGDHDYLVPVTGGGPTCSILGNALERGYGITPHADHFGAVTAMEAVLADGRIYRSALSGLNAEHLDHAHKWGVGPYLDGMFTQAGFAVVTRMTLALARRPDCVNAFIFGLADRDHVRDIVGPVREVIARYPGIVGGVNLMNSHRVLSMSADYPRDRLGAEGLIPPEVIAQLSRSNDILPWTGFGTIYGSRGVTAAVRREIRQILRPLARRLVFFSPGEANGLARVASFLPGFLRRRVQGRVEMLSRSLQLVAGTPNETALPLAYWMGGNLPKDGLPMDPARDGCGLIWYAPLVVMKPDQVGEYVDMVETIMRQYRLEPLITLTSISDRCFDSTVPLLFDAKSEESRANADACYWALLEAGRSKGYVPYRVGIQTMEWLTRDGGTYWELVRDIKRLMDPAGILSPGRYV